jgi:prepilin-type N-terminal cleavage/methylation domain-containing protein
MRSRRSQAAQRGFTLLELMTALGIFLLISGAAFTLLATSQKRYQTESQLLNSLQEARFGLDQMVRDINDSGFPPQNYFFTPPADTGLYAVTPFAWSPGYVSNSTCQIGVCSTPADFDLIIETNLNPTISGSRVQWVRYQLNGNTLMRGVVDKPTTTGDPDAATSAPGVMVAYVQNVVNNSSAAQIASFQTYYPTMFPTGNPVPIFTYTCDTSLGPVSCGSAGGSNNPANIRDVMITLIVQTPTPDQQTGAPRLLALTGRGHRINPNQ